MLYSDKSLPSSQRNGIVSVIPKTYKDLLYIKKWIPLNLLNTLYRLVSMYYSID